MKDITYAVTADSKTATRLDVSARDFTIVIDEPAKLGGSNAGPNPLEYELAALAGCINVTGHAVAREMGITLTSLTMELSGSLNPARFMGRGQQERAGFKTITVALQIDSDASTDALDAWCAAVEDRCPVSDNLSTGTSLNIHMKE